MAGSVLEEVLRIVLETKGQEGLDSLRKAMVATGDVSDATVAEVDKLIDQLVALNAAAGKAERMQQLAADVASSGKEMNAAATASYQFGVNLLQLSKRSEELQAGHKAAKLEVERLGAAMKEEGANTKELGAAHKAAQAEVKRFGDELKDNERDIKAVAAAQKSARAEMEKIEVTYAKQAEALDKLDKELSESGRDTKDLAKLQDGLAAEVTSATAAIEKQAKAVQAESQAAAALKQRLDDGDAAMRKFAQSGTASAEALKRYREGADGAAAGTRNLADQGGRLTSMFTGLRSLIAPVLAYLSFDAAKRGVQNLAGVGAAAEDARRALQNLYGGVEEGNRAYEGLRAMAKASGLAFADLVDDAKKLKAFGLDPLNGSLQALIDQNAAVGGSQQDLSGKVLALGQAWAKQKLQGEEILQLVERGVPVWSLLEKATGKNVQELQKLSEAGKLGRDVIQKLYEEIGRANTGAAERGLSSLSGLLAQASARWQDFLQRVADSGVTDYLKQRIGSLLGSTANLDTMAKRVADGVIGMLEAIRNLGTTLAPIGAAIGSLTLFMARHAEAIVNVVKAWALFRAIEIAAGFGRITQSILTATTALVAQNTALAATASAGGAVGSLSGLFAALTTRITAAAAAALNLVRLLGIPAAVVSGVYALAQAYEGVIEANNKLWQSEARMRSQQADQLRLGQQLQQMYRESGAVAIESAEAVGQKTREQAIEYKFALEQARLYYKGVINEAVATGDALTLASGKERFDALGEAITSVTGHLEKLKAAADPRGLQAFADAAVTKFDELVTKSKDAKAAISGIFDGVDFRTADGIRQASDILTQITARGTDAGRAIKAELGAALAKVAQEDLPKLKLQADAAMAAGVTGAKQFSDAIASVNLSRLGVDIEAIKTGFTAAGRSAVDAFRGAVKEVDDLGLTVEQRSQAIAQAFDNAFKQASTKAELAALKVAIQDALSSGDIGFAEFQARVAETDAKIAALSGTGQKMGADVASGAKTASTALSGMSSAASDAAENVDKVGDSAQGAGNAAGRAKPELQSFSLGLDNISEAAKDALLATNKIQLLFKGMTSGGFGRNFTEAVNNITRAIRQQQAAVDDLIAGIKRQNAAYDENEQRLIALRAQYGYLADEELQRLIDAENELRENRERAAEEERQRSDEAIARYREQGEAAAEAAKQAAESGSVLTGRSGASAQAQATATKQVLDSASSAAEAIQGAANAVSSAELTLRVIAEPNQGVAIVLSKQQIDDIAAAVIRTLSLAKSTST